MSEELVEILIETPEFAETPGDIVALEIESAPEVIEIASDTVEITETVIEEVVIDLPQFEFVEIGIQGPKGVAGIGLLFYAFSWGDSTPAVIIMAHAGKKAYKTEVILSEAFNADSTLTLGDSADPSRLFDAGDIDLTLPGTYQSHKIYQYTTDTPINLYLTPGAGNSAGSGLILVYLQD